MPIGGGHGALAYSGGTGKQKAFATRHRVDDCTQLTLAFIRCEHTCSYEALAARGLLFQDGRARPSNPLDDVIGFVAVEPSIFENVNDMRAE